MNKKIAVFANGWSNEYIQDVMKGLRRYSDEHQIDIDIFLSHTSSGNPEDELMGEFSILRLPDLQRYDGAISLTNSFNLKSEIDYLHKTLLDSKIPCISLELDLPGIPFIGSDNYTGMYQLAEHIMKDHGKRKILYLGGPKDHAEAAIRLQAVIDVCKKYDVPFDDTNQCACDWSFYIINDVFDDFVQNHDGIPDAIICANDIMAIGACDYLRLHSYQVPDDILVTGFDGLLSGESYIPPLTSVGRNWESMGYQAIKYVLEDAANASASDRMIQPSSFLCRESCGCTPEPPLRRNSSSFTIGTCQRMGEISFDIQQRYLYSVMRNITKKEDLHTIFTDYLLRDVYKFEPDTVFLCMDPNFFVAGVQDGISTLCQGQLPDKLLAVSAVYNQKSYAMEEFNTKDLYPPHIKNPNQTDIMIYIPLHLSQYVIGYAGLRALEDQLSNYTIYAWGRNLYQIFDQINANIQIEKLTHRLKTLSITDGLTGLYNRNGINDILIPFYQSCIKNKQQLAILMCDIDDMKLINDKYGHLQGDMAICILAQAARNTIPEDAFACRYGGDEFIILFTCESTQYMQQIISAIEQNIMLISSEEHIPFTLKASIGGILIKDSTLDYDRAISLADQEMYRTKQQHKEQTGHDIR